jgi:glycerol kinase
MTDVTNASRTLLFNIHTLKWDEDLLKILNIPKEILPEVRSSSEIYGKTNTPVLPGSIPICGIAGDQQAALIGQACFSKGMVKTTYGTGCFLLMNTNREPVISKNNLLTTVAYQIKDELAYALEGSVFIGGAVVQWLRDNLKMIKKSRDIEKLALSVPDSGGVFFVPCFYRSRSALLGPLCTGSLSGTHPRNNRCSYCKKRS